MEIIHLKTIDPLSQELLRDASRSGVELSWERYERLQPQDGFLRLGLSCPFGCMQGPCRIDPFGRGSKKGLCGLARNEMAAGMLLRLCLQGAMEVAGAVSDASTPSSVNLTGKLQDKTNNWLSANGLDRLTLTDIFKSSLMLQGPAGSSAQMVRQAARLGLTALELFAGTMSQKHSGMLKYSAGYGCIADDQIKIGLSGQIPESLLHALSREISLDQIKPVQLLSLGEWYCLDDRVLPLVCSSGEAELLASSGALHSVVAGPGTTPGLVTACEQAQIPVVFSQEGPSPADIVELSLSHQAGGKRSISFAGASSPGKGTILRGVNDLAGALANNPDAAVALVGGMDTVQQPLGQLPVELATRMSESGALVAGWGDAAIWMSKHGLTDPKLEPPILTLNNLQGMLQAVSLLADSDGFGRLQGICFTGLKRCSELAVAVGLATLGCRVCLAAPLPIMGSTEVCQLLADSLQPVGGELTYFDRPPRVQEILDWFKQSETTK